MGAPTAMNVLVRTSPAGAGRGLLDHTTTTFGTPLRVPSSWSSSQGTQPQLLVVKAKGKKNIIPRQYQRSQPPDLPKIEDDGNPKFVFFIRTANLPTQEELKTVLDKVKDFFGNAKESFGKITTLSLNNNEDSEVNIAATVSELHSPYPKAQQIDSSLGF